MVIGNTFQRFPEKTRFFTFSARQEIVLNLAFLQNDCIFTESLWFWIHTFDSYTFVKNILFVLLNNCLCWCWYKNAWFSSSWYWWWLVFALFAGVCDGGGVYCVVSHSLCGVCDVRRWCDFPSPWTSLAPPPVPFWHCALVCSLLPLFVPIVDFWILF